MSLLYVCDGCDVRARSLDGQPPPGWTTRATHSKDGRYIVDACAKPECVTKVLAMEQAPDLVLPF